MPNRKQGDDASGLENPKMPPALGKTRVHTGLVLLPSGKGC